MAKRRTRQGVGQSKRAPGKGGSAPRRKGLEPVKKPWPVPLVTGIALVLPGAGQLLNGDPMRGIVMQFFMLFLGLFTYLITGPDISIVGRFAGGIFIYVISVLDAYMIAGRRRRAWARKFEDTGATEPGSPS
jgi:hypothetical protein